MNDILLVNIYLQADDFAKLGLQIRVLSDFPCFHPMNFVVL
jgi:hypothetical protein